MRCFKCAPFHRASHINLVFWLALYSAVLVRLLVVTALLLGSANPILARSLLATLAMPDSSTHSLGFHRLLNDNPLQDAAQALTGAQAAASEAGKAAGIAASNIFSKLLCPCANTAAAAGSVASSQHYVTSIAEAHPLPAYAPAPAPAFGAGLVPAAAVTIEPALDTAPAASAPATEATPITTPVPGANVCTLAQIQPNDPSKPAQPFGYRNPKPLIQIEPKMLIDEKNRQAIVDRGDVLPADGTRIPLPGGFLLPTTGLWSRILDNPEGTTVDGPVPAPDLAPAAAAPAENAPATAPAPFADAVPANPLSFLTQGIAKVRDALEAQINKERKLLEGQWVV
ncbi:g4108 [Coccomyxa viridis]|uniref:G4108 protein n=1 Tax=Coccomyxa viridis TaxID=1274662 RepID=A0ABP1FUH7_9CHLO